MANNKISYAGLKLKTKIEKEIIDFEDNKIEVYSYLPIEDKFDLIMITLQESLIDGYYNPVKLEMNFNLNLVYMYTNINFTEKQKEDSAKLYDALKSNNLLDMILAKIPEREYNDLMSYIENAIEMSMKYKNSAAGIVHGLITDLPKQAEAMRDILDNFDPDKFQMVKDFAKAANGGRDI